MNCSSCRALTFYNTHYLTFQKDEAMLLVRDAIAAGIFNDLGSGSNVDLCVINKDNKVEYLRPYDVANQKGVRLVKRHWIFSVPPHNHKSDVMIIYTCKLILTSQDSDISLHCECQVFIPSMNGSSQINHLLTHNS